MGSIEGKIRLVIMLLDTNIIVDVALERQPHFQAQLDAIATQNLLLFSHHDSSNYNSQAIGGQCPPYNLELF